MDYQMGRVLGMVREEVELGWSRFGCPVLTVRQRQDQQQRNVGMTEAELYERLDMIAEELIRRG